MTSFDARKNNNKEKKAALVCNRLLVVALVDFGCECVMEIHVDIVEHLR